jgi:GAF domain
MDHYSILDNHPAQATPGIVSSAVGSAAAAPLPSGSRAGAAAAPALAREPLRFPGEDGGRSLSEMAQRDLDAALQLLAERAQYITGASGAAIALRDGETMICCASAGPSAPELGAHLQIDTGLSAESVRTKKTLRCDDAANDPRVNRESCVAFGIASVVVMPLVRGKEVYGVFELLSGRPRAFEERDLVALQRLAEMIETAVEHAEAARRAEKELGSKPEPRTTAPAPTAQKGNTENNPEKQVAPPKAKPELATAAPLNSPKPTAAPSAKAALAEILEVSAPEVPAPEAPAADINQPRPGPSIAFGNVGVCAACGFPVSQGRKFCLDCEAANPTVNAPSNQPAEFFGQLSDDSDPSWVRSHVYLIATVLIVAATVVVLIWRF